MNEELQIKALNRAYSYTLEMIAREEAYHDSISEMRIAKLTEEAEAIRAEIIKLEQAEIFKPVCELTRVKYSNKHGFHFMVETSNTIRVFNSLWQAEEFVEKLGYKCTFKEIEVEY